MTSLTKDDLLANLSQKLNQPSQPLYTLSTLPNSFYHIDQLAVFQQIETRQKILNHAGIASPYFLSHQTIARETTTIDNQNYINFASYNYLGLNGLNAISDAAKQAIDQYGTSVSSSRIVSGERPLHRRLEQAIANVYRAEDAVVFVSGHATNVSTIGHLFGKDDLILHDELSHNSIIQGALLSGAARLSFPHNDIHALTKLLQQHRLKYQKTLIVTEGLFSMDGDMPPLAELVKLKRHYKTFLMVDEAHSLGVLGNTGKGIFEQQNIDPNHIDIWMGTLSKTLASCGGYIAGNKKLIEYLRYTAPGFLYSVGLAPPLAAASLAAIEYWQSHSERVSQLQKNSAYFLQQAKRHQLNTGHAQGFAIIPIVIGHSLKTVKIAQRLMTEPHIIAQPVIYPAIPEKHARLRFFIASDHRKNQIDQTIQALSHIILETNHHA